MSKKYPDFPETPKGVRFFVYIDTDKPYADEPLKKWRASPKVWCFAKVAVQRARSNELNSYSYWNWVDVAESDRISGATITPEMLERAADEALARYNKILEVEEGESKAYDAVRHLAGVYPKTT